MTQKEFEDAEIEYNNFNAQYYINQSVKDIEVCKNFNEYFLNCIQKIEFFNSEENGIDYNQASKQNSKLTQDEFQKQIKDYQTYDDLQKETQIYLKKNWKFYDNKPIKTLEDCNNQYEQVFQPQKKSCQMKLKNQD